MLQRLPEDKRHIKQAKPEFNKVRSRMFRREKTGKHEFATSEVPVPVKRLVPEKKMEIPEKKMVSVETAGMPDAHKTYLVQNFDAFPIQPLFHVTPKKPTEKMSRKQIYPVFFIETMPVKAQQHEDMDEEKAKDVMNDLDDDEVLQGKADNATPTMLTVVWLLVGNKNTNELMWVDSSEVYYLQ